MTSVQTINSATTFKANNLSKKKQYVGTGIGVGVAATLGTLALCTPASKGYRVLNALKSFAKVLPLYAGPGLLVDCLNNNQREKGNEYTKVNSGKKYGAILGVVSPLIMGIIDRNKINLPFVAKIATLGISALCGYGLGVLTDKIENKQAAKEADKEV